MNATEIARELVRIPSVNPDGDPGTSETGERACAGWLADFAESHGACVELREVLPGRPNIFARWFPDRGKPKMLFAPHTDTVSVLGMTIDPFAGEIRDGRLYGRGATDTKGPMAAMLHALCRAAEWAEALPFELCFAGLVGEEAGQHGAKALAAQEDFAFVMAGEPTGLDTVYTHKGSAWTRLRTNGRAVHASRPQDGSNAIYTMCEVIAYLRTEVEAELASHHHPVLGRPTFSVGTIKGGSKVNIVPDSCEAVLDVRIIPGLTPDIVADLLKARFPDLDVSVLGSLPLATDPGHPLIARLGQCGSRPVGAPWFCDAAVFAAKGCPAVAIGPGDIAQAHTADEFIETAEIERGSDFFLSFLESLKDYRP